MSGMSSSSFRSTARKSEVLAFPMAIKVYWHAICKPNSSEQAI